MKESQSSRKQAYGSTMQPELLYGNINLNFLRQFLCERDMMITMKALYEQYYQRCLAQQKCIEQGDNQALTENIEKKESLIFEIKQLNQPITDDLRPLLQKIATLEKQNMQKAKILLDQRRKQAVEIDKKREQIQKYI